MPVAEHVTVTAAELVRQFGRWQDEAAVHPVVVTHHGRGRAVLLSYGKFTEMAEPHPNGEPNRRMPGIHLMSELMEHIDQGFMAFDSEMRVRAVNAAACCFMKADRDTLIGQRIDEIFPGAEDTVGYASLLRAVRSGQIETFETPSFAFENRWLMFRAFPCDGGSACVFRDITDELEARAMVDSKHATLAALAVHGGVGRAKLTVRGTFTQIDEVFASFAGFTPDGLTRARLNDIIVPRQRRQASEAIEAVLDGGKPKMLDVDLLTKQGAERPVRIGLSSLRNASGPAGAVAVVTDRLL